MQILSNAHTHTTWCDGKNTVEEMIQQALKLNFVSLGFSVHGWTPYEPCPITLEREEAYKAELRRMQEKYKGQIEIMIGAERDSMFEREFSGFEYLIDSTHWFEKNGELISVDWSEDRMLDWVHRHFGDDFYAYARAYYEKEADMCAKSDAAFIGHIDLVTKFNEGYKYFDETDPRYLKYALEAADCALEKHIPLEMNTGAIARGYRSKPYPNPAILKHIYEKGGQIIINGDSHSAAALDTGYDLCIEAAKTCGFKHVLRMRASGWEELPLKD